MYMKRYVPFLEIITKYSNICSTLQSKYVWCYWITTQSFVVLHSIKCYIVGFYYYLYYLLDNCYLQNPALFYYTNNFLIITDEWHITSTVGIKIICFMTKSVLHHFLWWIKWLYTFVVLIAYNMDLFSSNISIFTYWTGTQYTYF